MPVQELQPGKQNVFKRVARFFEEVIAELRKVNWTTRSELIDSTIVVIVSIFVMAVIIGVLDYFLTMFLDKVIR